MIPLGHASPGNMGLRDGSVRLVGRLPPSGHPDRTVALFHATPVGGSAQDQLNGNDNRNENHSQQGGNPMPLKMHERITAELLDAGTRASDTINEYRAHRTWDELRRKWIAISLADGSHDGTLYDTRKDCVKHQNYENQYTYVAFQSLMGGAKPRDMAILILFYRDAYAAGFRGTDPDALHGGRDLAMPAKRFDAYRHLPSLELASINDKFIMPGRVDLSDLFK